MESILFVIEDDPGIRITLQLQEVLETEGYTVLSAESGEAGLEMLKSRVRPSF